MAMTLEQRILWILRDRGLSQRALSKDLGFSRNYVGALLTRLRQDPSGTLDTPQAVKLARFANVSQEWLTTGEGEPRQATGADDSLALLEQRAGWVELLAEAKRTRPRGIPEKLYDLVGKFVVPVQDLTVQDIHKAAELLFLAASREPTTEEPIEEPPRSGPTSHLPPGATNDKRRPTG